MTHDPHRQWPKPLENATKALLKRRYYDGEEEHYDGLEGFWRDLDPDHWFDARSEAQAVLDSLSADGFLKGAA